jgi:hypothetical protein
LAGNGAVVFNPTVVDTADGEPVAVAPPPFQTRMGPGPPWRGSGRLCLSLLGADTNSLRLEMDSANLDNGTARV